MLSSILAKPTVQVTVEQDTIFVRPTADPSFPSEDPEIRGTVLVTMPTRRAVKSINVVFEGLCDAYGGPGFPYESSTTLSKRLDLDLEGTVLEAGNHSFNFSFIVPSSTAVYQRCTFGRVRHYIKATLNCASGLSSSFASAPCALWISAHPNALREAPETFEAQIEHFSEDIGPVGVGISSPHLTVASLLNLRVALLGPPEQVTIQSITCSVVQAFEISFKDGSVSRPPAKSYRLAPVATQPTPKPILPYETSDNAPLKDLEPLYELDKGEEFKWSKLMRIPDDDHCRPTTLEGTDTRIRASHKICVEIRYRKQGETKDMVVSILKPIQISSCCSALDSIYLPVYARTAPKTIIRPVQFRCLCNLSLKEMVDRDGFALERAGSIDAASSDSRTLGCERVEKSPGYQEGLGWTTNSPTQ
ncbi:hypothetical protein T439DRAFT_330189 [Meredithblackwellia eburnea MCA 4105]